jgi:hypothetical protein
VLTLVQQGGEPGAVVLALVQRVYLEDRLQLPAGAGGGVAGFGELGEVAGDLTLGSTPNGPPPAGPSG